MYDFLKAGFSDEGSAFLFQFFALYIALWDGLHRIFFLFFLFTVILLSMLRFFNKKIPRKEYIH